MGMPRAFPWGGGSGAPPHPPWGRKYQEHPPQLGSKIPPLMNPSFQGGGIPPLWILWPNLAENLGRNDSRACPVERIGRKCDQKNQSYPSPLGKQDPPPSHQLSPPCPPPLGTKFLSTVSDNGGFWDYKGWDNPPPLKKNDVPPLGKNGPSCDKLISPPPFHRKNILPHVVPKVWWTIFEIYSKRNPKLSPPLENMV